MSTVQIPQGYLNNSWFQIELRLLAGELNQPIGIRVISEHLLTPER